MNDDKTYKLLRSVYYNLKCVILINTTTVKLKGNDNNSKVKFEFQLHGEMMHLTK